MGIVSDREETSEISKQTPTKALRRGNKRTNDRRRRAHVLSPDRRQGTFTTNQGHPFLREEQTVAKKRGNGRRWRGK